MGTSRRVGWGYWAEGVTMAGPACHSVSPGPAKVSWAIAQPLTASSGWTKRGPRFTWGPGLGSPWSLLVTNSPSPSGCRYPWQHCRAFLSPGLLGFQASAPPTTSRMAPESCQEAEDAEEEALPSLVDRKPVSGHVGPPASAPADPVASACPQDTKPSSTGMLSSVNLQSSRSQEKFLQNQVQKLTLELEEQKEQAQLEKAHLEERLLQARNMLQQLEAELQAFQKSCLLQLACSSWVGRMLRSSTGNVEVVTAETLMDPSDLSENDQAATAGEGFRLEDVDWNSIAHRFPNLFTNLESNSDPKHPQAPPPPQLPPATPSDQWSSELCYRNREHRLKSVEWSALPLVGTSSSGGADSESSSCLLAVRYHVHQVTGDPPQAPGHTAEQVEAQAQSLFRDTQAASEGRLSLDLQKSHLDRQSKNGREPEYPAHPHSRLSGCCPSPSGACLKIVAVSRRQRFVRILNQSLEDTADLGDFVLQQQVRDFPVCMYRFPPGTLLAPRHHITVWGEAPGSTKRQPPSCLGREPVHFHSSRGCVTLLLNPQGEVLSEHQAPHCVTPVPRTFADNTDLSTDRFPLSEARPEADLLEQQPQPRPPCEGRVREAGAGRRRPRTRVQLPRLNTGRLFRQRQVPARPEGAAETHPAVLPAVLAPGECAAGRHVEGGTDSEEGAAGRPHPITAPRRGHAAPPAPAG
ncbi:lamin tail domain-containing protein 2 isoform X3 [Hippopotamus amphibius kiboko]|uniref:lamin tail domain-containing protein 2 isoform X3 n=1 Tax=Hippopotamus amphibius kiboko TaxID=575201 RepID=UPI002594816A|nr:lamin tail domain-containing protein 2 isoform X3 [Hippopotamus amphibius kiboko]